MQQQKIIHRGCLLIVVATALLITFVAPSASAASKTSSAVPSASLRAAYYETLAKNAGTNYRFDDLGCGTLPEQSLKACFNNTGANFILPAKGTGELAGRSIGLRLAAFGRGSSLAPLHANRPQISGNRVSYQYGDVIEWWRVLPIGFEQGFTIVRRPAGNGELTLVLADNHAAKMRGGEIAWGRLRYGDLAVTDATGRTVPATLKTEGSRVFIAVNDAKAAYPLTVDPLVFIEQQVTAGDPSAYALFGGGVAISGTTAMIGAFGATIGSNTDQGAVYVFKKANGIWAQTQKLYAKTGVPYGTFGRAIALQGNTALIGACGYHGDNRGAVYVFTNSNGTWVQTQRLTASDGEAGDSFCTPALDGSTAVIGASGAKINDQIGAGAAYVFVDSGGTWQQTQKLTSAAPIAGAAFGASVAVQNGTALIGSPYLFSDEGEVFVFTRSDITGIWSETQLLTTDDSVVNDHFGWAIALDGDTALIGRGGNDGGAGRLWSAYIFTRTGGYWSQAQEIISSDTSASDLFGSAVALQGSTALIGASGTMINGNPNLGAAYVYRNSNGTWTQAAELTASDYGVGPGVYFGYFVAFDGTTPLVGAPGYSGSQFGGQGAAYFYNLNNLALALDAPATVPSKGQYLDTITVTNNGGANSSPVSLTVPRPAGALFVSATATQGSCSMNSDLVTCDFGRIAGSGEAVAYVTLEATGNAGDTIDNTAQIVKATPPLTASASTVITQP